MQFIRTPKKLKLGDYEIKQTLGTGIKYPLGFHNLLTFKYKAHLEE